jgi:hypothetical protein
MRDNKQLNHLTSILLITRPLAMSKKDYDYSKRLPSRKIKVKLTANTGLEGQID